MFSSCLDKQSKIALLFTECPNKEAKYHKIIEIGRQQPVFDPKHRIPDNIVKGCQSTMYLHSYHEDGRIFFSAESEALISSGLAALLVTVYSGETAETILKCPPDYLEKLGIQASLTPSRANGLYSVHLRMKQDALKFLINSK
jgi:cysteine desulfuration protein SufE